MSAIKITRLSVDPITFRESIGLVYIPRIEDTILDDQLAAGSYVLPRKMSILLARTRDKKQDPPPLSPSSSTHREAGNSEQYRPPTPPKVRDMRANSPRRSPGSGVPRRSSEGNFLLSPPLPVKNLAMSPLAMVSETSSDTSLSDLMALARSPLVIRALAKSSAVAKKRRSGGDDRNPKQKYQVRFADEVEMNEISFLRKSLIGELFYGSEDLAEFRYEAFMEEAGLDVMDFD